MKLFRYSGLILILLFLQSCGGKTDTSGSLTISTPTVADQKCGFQTVTATVTYTPPTGKVPNGVQVVVTELENNVLMHRATSTLTDSPTVNFTYIVTQQISAPTIVVINAAVGDMTSSVPAFVPAATFSTFSGCSGTR